MNRYITKEEMIEILESAKEHKFITIDDLLESLIELKDESKVIEIELPHFVISFGNKISELNSEYNKRKIEELIRSNI